MLKNLPEALLSRGVREHREIRTGHFTGDLCQILLFLPPTRGLPLVLLLCAELHRPAPAQKADSLLRDT